MNIASQILQGDRAALAQAITLSESTRSQDRVATQELLAEIWPRTGDSLRIGLTGAPGVGKSTLANTLGMHILEQGHRLAVLAVDPSSQRDQGAILGDKTRMAELARQERAFIRPSPAGNHIGGVALRTQEAICLCEAAGYDVILVETLGTGQSESAVAKLTDLFILLIAPGQGDYLQGMKRGVLELADLLLVNKYDGSFAETARQTLQVYRSALDLQRPCREELQIPNILGISALEGTHILEIWESIHTLDTWRRKQGYHQEQRRQQARDWVQTMVTQGLLERLAAQSIIPAEIGQAIDQNSLDPITATNRILDQIIHQEREVS